jgi:hypothetical protein
VPVVDRLSSAVVEFRGGPVAVGFADTHELAGAVVGRPVVRGTDT